MHINAIAKRVLGKSVYKLYFVSTKDMGPGGMRYDWTKVSKTIPIAEIYKVTSNSYSMKWFGLFYDGGQKMGLSTEFTHDNILSKCIIPNY